ncbi:hypothetical protein AO1008_09887 [Aspergillus oryzae 100-8]|uniref:Hydrophobin n=1 Tax=Aspergillus oryzae (strain 3.042) TaxID=1160506 RepID=I8A785_ASPO3|nr:hypothetical protein Ao3042_02517 [Aspergillus oryzae 3.042]KDE83306.1 hypothetical protein AO1008_09887 [Aspergillus oryzae 100-8]|eukprot:EIT80952.1 hypothetical protein Ao3042_02517 [Aspergillus oryzae 3.042]
MQFRSVIALVAFATAVTAAPCDSCDGGDSGDSGDSGKCSPNQELKCCTGLTQGLNLGILPALCLRTPELSHHPALSSSHFTTASNDTRAMSGGGVMRDSVNGYVLLRLGGDSLLPASRCTRIVLGPRCGN